METEKSTNIRAQMGAILRGIVIIIALFTAASSLPQASLDPWGLFQIQKIIFLIALIASIQLVGFVSNLLLGARVGMIVTGFLGGVVSSTAVFVSLPKSVQHNPHSYQQAVAAGLSALMAMKIQMLVILFSTSKEMFNAFVMPVSLMIFTCGALIFILSKQKSKIQMDTSKTNKPIDIFSVIKLSLLIVFMLAAVALSKRFLGDSAIIVTSFLSGLFELHGITLANSVLFASQNVGFDTAHLSIGLALIASYLSKAAITWSLNRGAYAASISVSILIVIGVGVLSFFIKI